MCFRRWRRGGEVSRGRQGDRAAQTGVGEGTSALGRARRTPGQGGGTSALGRPRRTPGQGGGTSGRAPQATAGAPGAQGARPQRPLRLDLNPLLSPEASVSNPYRPISALEPVTFGNCRCANLSRTVLSMGPGWVHWTRPPSPLVPRSLGQGEELGWLLKPGPGEGAEGAAAGGSSALRGLGGGPRALRRQVFTGPLLRAGQALGPISERRHRPQAPPLPGPERGPRAQMQAPFCAGPGPASELLAFSSSPPSSEGARGPHPQGARPARAPPWAPPTRGRHPSSPGTGLRQRPVGTADKPATARRRRKPPRQRRRPSRACRRRLP